MMKSPEGAVAPNCRVCCKAGGVRALTMGLSVVRRSQPVTRCVSVVGVIIDGHPSIFRWCWIAITLSFFCLSVAVKSPRVAATGKRNIDDALA